MDNRLTQRTTDVERPVLSPSERRLLEKLFRGVRHTLLNRGLYRELKDGRRWEVSWKHAFLLRDIGVIAFQVDTLRLPVGIEKLMDPDVAHQMQATLNGRRVKVTNSRGLAFSVELEPRPPRSRRRLPRRAPLDLAARPEGDYLIPIGLGGDGRALDSESRGSKTLDLGNQGQVLDSQNQGTKILGSQNQGQVWRSLLDTGHVLVGGESGSGKSTWLHAMLVALLDAHPPEELRVALVDPKEVEFLCYRGVSHLFDEIATEVDAAEALLARLTAELDRRRALFAGLLARDLAAYNRAATERGEAPLPLLLLVVDEVTDVALQAGLKSDFYTDLIRLTSKGRAFGLVVVLATQHPKAEVLNTLIRGNLSTRVAFRVATAAHSRTILGLGGAEKLPRTIRGRLLARLDGAPVTLQGFYVADEDLRAITTRLRTEPAHPFSDLKRALVQHAVNELDGQFHTEKLWQAFCPRISRKEVQRLARRWEKVGWLSSSRNPSVARRVTDELHRLSLEENHEG